MESKQKAARVLTRAKGWSKRYAERFVADCTPDEIDCLGMCDPVDDQPADLGDTVEMLLTAIADRRNSPSAATPAEEANSPDPMLPEPAAEADTEAETEA